MKTILLLILLLPITCLADALTEQQMQEYVNATVQGEELSLARELSTEDLVPDTSISTADVELVTDDGILLYIIEKPSMENLFVSPPPEKVIFPLSQDQLSKLAKAWVERAVREGKPEMYYVDLARASEGAQRFLAKSTARSGFEIYPNSNLFNQFPDHITCEQNYYHCALENSILKAEVIKLNNIIKSLGKPCDDKGWGGANVWKAKSDGRSGGVVVLDRKYCNGSGGALISDLSIENEVGMSVASVKFRQCDAANAGRYHLDFNPEGKKLTGPVFVRYNYNGINECRKVGNPSVDQR